MHQCIFYSENVCAEYLELVRPRRNASALCGCLHSAIEPTRHNFVGELNATINTRYFYTVLALIQIFFMWQSFVVGHFCENIDTDIFDLIGIV